MGHEVMAAQPPERKQTTRHRARRLIEFGKWVAEPEHLPPAPPRPIPSSPSSGFSAWFENREPLPSVPIAAPSGRNFFSWLISSDPLPDRAGPREQTAGSLLRWLFSRDRLDTHTNDRADEGGPVS